MNLFFAKSYNYALYINIIIWSNIISTDGMKNEFAAPQEEDAISNEENTSMKQDSNSNQEIDDEKPPTLSKLSGKY